MAFNIQFTTQALFEFASDELRVSLVHVGRCEVSGITALSCSLEKHTHEAELILTFPPSHPSLLSQSVSFLTRCDSVTRCLDKHLTQVSSRPDNRWQTPMAKSNYFCSVCSKEQTHRRRKTYKTLLFPGSVIVSGRFFFTLLLSFLGWDGQMPCSESQRLWTRGCLSNEQ